MEGMEFLIGKALFLMEPDAYGWLERRRMQREALCGGERMGFIWRHEKRIPIDETRTGESTALHCQSKRIKEGRI